jgi:hypothetical protein
MLFGDFDKDREGERWGDKCLFKKEACFGRSRDPFFEKRQEIDRRVVALQTLRGLRVYQRRGSTSR